MSRWYGCYNHEGWIWKLEYNESCTERGGIGQWVRYYEGRGTAIFSNNHFSNKRWWPGETRCGCFFLRGGPKWTRTNHKAPLWEIGCLPAISYDRHPPLFASLLLLISLYTWHTTGTSFNVVWRQEDYCDGHLVGLQKWAVSIIVHCWKSSIRGNRCSTSLYTRWLFSLSDCTPSVESCNNPNLPKNPATSPIQLWLVKMLTSHNDTLFPSSSIMPSSFMPPWNQNATPTPHWSDIAKSQKLFGIAWYYNKLN